MQNKLTLIILQEKAQKNVIQMELKFLIIQTE